MYSVIGKIIGRVIPLWNMTLTALKFPDPSLPRIVYTDVVYEPDPESWSEAEGPQQADDEDENEFWDRRQQWIRDTRRIVQPEPGEFKMPFPPVHVDLKRDYGERGLQVIVKLANIVLTPEKAEYKGGAWHVEGQLVRLPLQPFHARAYKKLLRRTSISARRQSITTTTSTLPQAPSLFASNRAMKLPKMSIIPRTKTNGWKTSLGVQIGRRLSNMSVQSTPRRDASSHGRTSSSARSSPSNLRTRQSPGTTRSWPSFSSTLTSESSRRRTCRVSGRTGGQKSSVTRGEGSLICPSNSKMPFLMPSMGSRTLWRRRRD